MRNELSVGRFRNRLFTTAILLFLSLTNSVLAQIGPPNDSGVSVGHVQLIVRDPEMHKKLWTTILGASVIRSGSMELLRLPALYVVLQKGEPIGPSAGSNINHVGLMIRNHEEIKAKVVAAGLEIAADNYRAAECAASPGTQSCQFHAVFPDGVRIEFTEDKTLNFTAIGHHIHIQTTDREGLRGWYAKTLGATAGMRRGTIYAALFNGNEVDFNPADEPQQPTKGRVIDHIGFEVKNLEAFCKKLEAAGVKFESPYRVIAETGLKTAFITDPVGTRIQLTEGLQR